MDNMTCDEVFDIVIATVGEDRMFAYDIIELWESVNDNTLERELESHQYDPNDDWDNGLHNIFISLVKSIQERRC